LKVRRGRGKDKGMNQRTRSAGELDWSEKDKHIEHGGKNFKDPETQNRLYFGSEKIMQRKKKKKNTRF